MREEIEEEVRGIEAEGLEAGRELSDITYGKARAMQESFDTFCIDACDELRHAGYSESLANFMQDILGQFGERVDWTTLAGHIVEDAWHEVRKERKKVEA